MGSSLDDVAFLANSANRVAALEALTREPRHRDDLLEGLGVSRVTLARILGDLESRRWVEGSGHVWAATPLGAWVAEEFARLLETMANERRLRDPLAWFPVDRMPFDVRCLSEATVVTPTQNDMTAHVQRTATCLRQARRVRVLSTQTVPSLVKATRIAVEEDAQRFESVLTRDLVGRLLEDPLMAPVFLELLETPLVEVYAYDGEPPVMFFISDETVGIPMIDESGVVRALVLSENDIVFDWAVRTFRAYRTRAEAVSPESLAV